MKTAVIDGTKCWYNDDGQYHREGGLPAIEYANGDRDWIINGEYHREDGPARWWPKFSNRIGYYLFGTEIPEIEYMSTPIEKLILRVKMTGIIET